MNSDVNELKSKGRGRRASVKALNESIRAFQQASGFGLRSYGKGVTEALRLHLLAIVCGEPGCSIDRLVEALHIPQPTASRAVKQLQQERELRVERSHLDSRRTELFATAKGNLIHETHNKEMGEIYSRLLTALTDDERRELFYLQGKFADGLGAVNCTHTNNVHPMQRNVVRITRGLKLLRTDTFKEHSISILAWLFLRMIALQPGMLSGKDFCQIFNAGMTTVSSVLITLVKEQLVKRVRDETDTRIHKLEVTRKGRQLLEAITKEQEAMLFSATKILSDLELERLVELTQRYLGISS
jgi:DNA-binding MarR family transcriptional regulator